MLIIENLKRDDYKGISNEFVCFHQCFIFYFLYGLKCISVHKKQIIMHTICREILHSKCADILVNLLKLLSAYQVHTEQNFYIPKGVYPHTEDKLKNFSITVKWYNK